MVNNKYTVIDAHCHIYPEKIAYKAVGSTDNFYGVHSYSKGTVEDLLDKGLDAGIDRFIVQSVATTPKQVPSINSFIASEVSAYKKRLIGLGTLHPESSDILGDVKNIVDLKLHGVKLHPDIQRFEIDDLRCMKIYELCERFNLPVLMHTGDSRYDFSNPNRLVPVLKEFPSLTVIGAHFGGWSIWEEASVKLNGYKNLYVDCSSSFNYISKDTARQIILRYGVDKVLFGTDYPMWDPKKELETFLSLGFSEEENIKMLSKNAIKVFKI